MNTFRKLESLSTESCSQVGGNLRDKFLGVEPSVSGWVVGVVHQDGEILGHVAIFHGLDDLLFQSVAKLDQFFVRVKLPSLDKTTSPGEDRGNRVGGGLSSFLVHSV